VVSAVASKFALTAAPSAAVAAKVFGGKQEPIYSRLKG
jgi:hypothetical protein